MDRIFWVLIIALSIIALWLYIQDNSDWRLNIALNSFNKTFNDIAGSSQSGVAAKTAAGSNQDNSASSSDSSHGVSNSGSHDGVLAHMFAPSSLKAMGQQAAFSLGLNLVAKAIDKKLVQKSGQFALRLAVKTLDNLGVKLGSKVLAKLGTKLALRIGTNVATKVGAQVATKATAAATLGPAGIVVLALEVVQLGIQIGLDASDAGGYLKMGTLETYYKIREEINKEFKKAMTSQTDSSGKPLPFPQIYGPLDVLMTKNQTSYTTELQQYATNITQDSNEPLMKNFQTAMKDFIAANPNGTPDDLSNWITANFDRYVDMDAVMAKAQAQQCTAHKGTMKGAFCSFATPADCKASMTWPPGPDNKDTYVEWDPETGACVVASSALYDACTSNNIPYDWNNRMCAIDQNYCASKGASWGYNKNINTNDCMISPTQEVFENIFGTTVTRGLIQVFDPNQYCPCTNGQKDEGLICQGCPAAHPYQIGALCYDNSWVSKPQPKSDCPSGMRDDGTSCWLDTYANGVGYIPNVSCPPGWTIRGIGNSSWCEQDQGYYNYSWGSAGCNGPQQDPVCGEVIKTCGGARGYNDCYQTWITKLVTQNSDKSCNNGDVMVAGLCYPKCKDGYEFAGGNLCQPIGGPGIKVTLMQRMQPCPSGSKNVAGICWSTPFPSTYGKLRKIAYSTKDSSGVLTGNC